VPFFSTGFDSVYKQRTANKNDGCAIFWDRNRFYSMGQKDVEFDDIVHLPENANATAEQKYVIHNKIDKIRPLNHKILAHFMKFSETVSQSNAAWDWSIYEVS
jgi:hypothetical protein